MGYLWRWLLCAVAAACAAHRAAGSADILSHVTAHFGKTLEECREESGLSKDVMEEFKHFWSEDFAVESRELGCAIICMSHKFSLLQEDVRMHHMNMDEYIKSFPDGEQVSAKMVSMIHSCEKQYDDVEEDCLRVVQVSACFRADARRQGMAPDLAMIEAVLEKYDKQ